jgi:heat shock protein HslJ
MGSHRKIEGMTRYGFLSVLFFGLAAMANPTIPSNGGQSQDIMGVHWKLTELAGRAVKGDFDQELFIEFKPENSFTGFAGCNKITGHYEFGNGRIHIMRIVGTMKGCAHLETEQDFKVVLEDANVYKRTGNALVLMKGDKIIARFTASGA